MPARRRGPRRPAGCPSSGCHAVRLGSREPPSCARIVVPGRPIRMSRRSDRQDRSLSCRSPRVGNTSVEPAVHAHRSFLIRRVRHHRRLAICPWTSSCVTGRPGPIRTRLRQAPNHLATRPRLRLQTEQDSNLLKMVKRRSPHARDLRHIGPSHGAQSSRPLLPGKPRRPSREQEAVRLSPLERPNDQGRRSLVVSRWPDA